jgi:hypothetical protein
MEDKECPLCKGTRHVLTEDGSWARCACYKDVFRGAQYAKNGLTFRPDNLGLTEDGNKVKTYFSEFNEEQASYKFAIRLNQHFKEKRLPVVTPCFSGSPTSANDFIVQSMLKTAIDSGFRVSSFSTEQLITAHFRGDEEEGIGNSMLEEFNDCDVFSLYFGSEIQFRLGRTYVSEIIRAHRVNPNKKSLILSTSLSYDDVFERYHSTFHSMFTRYSPSMTKEELLSNVLFLRIA